MQYLLLIYEREADWNAFSEKEKGAIFQEYMAFTQGIMKSGHHRAGDALLALMLLHDSRRDARLNADGEIVLLEEQDRSRWNRAQIHEGVRLLEEALRLGGP